jgi:hypothetical protein
MTSRLIVLGLYAALAMSAAALILLAHRPGTSLVRLSTLLQVILADRSVRVVVLLFWWWLGWHFLVEP